MDVRDPSAGALSDADQQAMIEALARSAVQDVAPEELPLFGPTSEAFFDPSRSADGGGSGADDMLGFGVDAAAAALLVTPIALETARSVLGYVLTELQSALKDEAKPMIQALAKRILHPGTTAAASTAAPSTAPPATPATPAADPLPFTEPQLQELHKVALRTAERMGMEHAKAAVVADAIVGAMAR